MPDLEPFEPRGMLHNGWTAQVKDYAIDCDWALMGKTFIVGDASGGLICFEGNSGNVLWERDNFHQGGLLSLSVNPRGNLLATSGQDGFVRFSDCETGNELSCVQLGKGWVEHLEWSHEDDLLAVVFSRLVYVFSSEGKEIWRSQSHPSTISSIAWSKKKELATSCYGQVAFYDIFKNKLNQKLKWKGSLISMKLSPDGDIVACGSQDNSVHFWRRSTGHDAEMTGYPAKPINLSFDNTGTLLATGGSERVTVWSFQGNGPEGTMPGELCHHTENISSLSFCNKGKLIASGSKDGSVVVSFLQNDGNGDPVGAAFAESLVEEIAWRPDDSALAAINSKGLIKVWLFKIR